MFPLILIISAVVLCAPVVPVPQPVHIRWADSLTLTQQEDALQRFGMRRIEVRNDGVWVVDASRASSSQLRMVVEDPAVADTGQLDRRRFRREDGAPVTVGQWVVQRVPALGPDLRARLMRALGPAKAPLVILFGAILAASAGAIRRGGVPRWRAGIPDLSPYGLSVFRIVLGVAVIAAVIPSMSPAVPHELQRQYDWLARQPLIRDIAASGDALTALHVGLVAAFACFAIGFMPRTSLAIGALLFTTFAATRSTRSAIHDLGLPTIALWLLVIAPWQEGFGVSASWRRWRGQPEQPPGRFPRGLALWLPGLAFGIAYLAAVYAKLDTSGLAWVTGGAVRYHFVEDARFAPVPWGMQVARSDAASVLLSLAAVLVESTLWLVIWFKRASIRVMFGVAGLVLLGGFYLFQGVFWPAWWMLLLAFFPWSPASDRLAAGLPRLTVLADGECPMCRRTARVLHALDWFDRVDFVDGSDDAARAAVAPQIDRASALREMHVLDAAGRARAGYDGYLSLARSVPLLWIPGLIGLLPPVAAVGRRVYARVAATRLRTANPEGRCTDDVCGREDASFPRRASATTTTAVRTLPATAIIVAAAFLLQQAAASTLRVESEPLISDYGMYAYTWPSQQAFDAHLLAKTRRYLLSTNALSARELEDRLRELPNSYDVFDDAIDRLVARESWSDGMRRAVAVSLTEYRARYGEPLGRVHVAIEERAFDWARGAFDDHPHMREAGSVNFEVGAFE